MFNNGTNGYSLADIAAATNTNGNDGFGWGGNGIGWIVILFILFIGGWNGGWGNNGFGGNGAGTVTASMDTDYLSTGIRDLQRAVSDDFYALNTGMLNGFCSTQNAIANSTANITATVTNGFNTQNLANLQNTNAIQRDIYSGTVGALQNTQALQATLAQMASDNRADTAQLAYNQATNTCAINTNNCNNTRDIIDAQNAGTRAVLDAIAQSKVDAMQDKINDLTAQNQTLQLAASQAAQNNYLVSELRPMPVPSYSVQNPWASCNCMNNGYLGTMA